MKFLVTSFLFSFLSISYLSAQENYTLTGQVLDVADSLPIPYVNIYENDYENFTSSNAAGRFSIQISRGDTLNFSVVGFRPKSLIMVPIKGIEQKIFLEQVTYELPGLTIFGRNAMEGFYDHNRLYNPETERSFRQKFPKPGVGVGPGGAGFTGLVTAFANLFNSEFQQLKKLREIKKDEYPYFRRLELIYVRLTPEYVVQNTSLNRSEVEGFLDFWDPPLEFMEGANEYQLLMEVQRQEKKYISEIKQKTAGGDVVSTIELRKLLDNFKEN